MAKLTTARGWMADRQDSRDLADRLYTLYGDNVKMVLDWLSVRHRINRTEEDKVDMGKKTG